MNLRPSPGRTGGPPLRGERDFWLLTGSALVSKLADQLLLFAIPLAVLATSHSIGEAVVAFAVRGAAYAVSPLLGMLIDAFDRRDAYIWAQIYQGACVALAAIVLHHVYLVALLVLLSGLGGVVSSISSFYVLVPSLVTEDRLSKAVSRFGALIEVAKVAGPLVAGSLVLLAGGTSAILVNSGIYLVSAGVAVLLPRIARPVAEPTSAMQGLRAAFSWIRRSPGTMALIASMALSNLGVGALDTIFITLLADAGVSPWWVGVVIGAGALGGAVGVWSAHLILPRRSFEQRILFWEAFIILGVATMGAPQVPLKVAGYVLACACMGASNFNSIRFRQESIPAALTGRVNSVIRMFIAGAIPVSGVLYAGVAQWTQVRFHWIPVIGLSILGSAVWALYMLRGSRTDDRVVEPSTAAS
jgi:MFS family permease